MELSRQSDLLNIHLEDGSTLIFEKIYTVDDVIQDVTGYTAHLEIRDIPGQTGDALLSLTESSGIAVGNADGKFTVTITAAQSTFGNRDMEYDLIITSGGVSTKLIRGKCTSHASVTI